MLFKMNLNFFKQLGEAIQKTIEEKQIHIKGIEKQEIELAQKLDAIEEYTIDRFEENKVIIENRETKEMKNIEKNKIPDNCKEGDIINCINGKYFLDEEQTQKTEKEIQEKYKNLWE